MEITALTPEGFRNLTGGRIEFHPRLNLIVGDNGQGKTNLLEALAIVSGRPSFRTADLSEALRAGEPRALLTARIRRPEAAPADRDGHLGARLSVGAREQFWNGERISRLRASRLAPIVFLTARDLARYGGPPAERRRALDRAAQALDPEYGRDLVAYEKARVSKGRLLGARSRFDADELAVYEEAMAVSGGRVAAARRRTLGVLERLLAESAARLRSSFADLRLEMASDLPADGTAEVLADGLRVRMGERAAEERRAGRCLVGPHRDDVVLSSGGAAVATRASSGENRTLVLAWTLAETALVGEAVGTAPALAFDDFDSEWDPGVLAAFAEGLPEDAQVFLTSARPDAVRGLPLPAGVLLRMARGRLSREGILGAGRGGADVRARAGER
ncbi:MAG TPA: DNA replication and repair protein RecF [Thermoanaerobaculia bacterium]|nr:DNA replication and repair protein RecF [Thermoanaerobaculia bacterium]